MVRVLGVDACRTGWVGIALDAVPRAYSAPRIDALVAQAIADGPLDVVGVDMPIGLPDSGYRHADVLAREVVGRLRSSVFMTPTRRALEAPNHATASALNRELTGAGISIQAFGLKPKLAEVERWAPGAQVRVVEVHPEVSFVHLAGGRLEPSKKTWAGATLRRRLLADAGIVLGDDLGSPGRAAAVDDVLDAAVAAWSARRVATGAAIVRPDPPESFSDGWPAAIWS